MIRLRRATAAFEKGTTVVYTHHHMWKAIEELKEQVSTLGNIPSRIQSILGARVDMKADPTLDLNTKAYTPDLIRRWGSSCQESMRGNSTLHGDLCGTDGSTAEDMLASLEHIAAVFEHGTSVAYTNRCIGEAIRSLGDRVGAVEQYLDRLDSGIIPSTLLSPRARSLSTASNITVQCAPVSGLARRRTRSGKVY